MSIKGRDCDTIILFSWNELAKSPTITQRACNNLCEMIARGLHVVPLLNSSEGVSQFAAGVPARYSALHSEVLLLDVVNNERESFGFLSVVNDGDG